MNQVNRNIVWMLLGQIGKFVVPLITLPYLTRVLGLEQYGVLAFAFAIATYLTMVATFGFNLSAVELVTRHRDDLESLEWTLGSVLTAQTLVFVVTTGAVLLVLFLLPGDSPLFWVLVCYLPQILGNLLLVQWFHQGLEKMANVATFVMISRFLSIPFVFWLIDDPSDTWLAALLQSMGAFGGGLMSLLYLVRKGYVRRPRFSPTRTRAALVESWPLFVTTAANNLYTSTVPVVLGLLSGPAAVGLFSVAQVFKNVAAQIMEAIYYSVFPRTLRYYEEDRPAMRGFVRKYFAICLGLGVVGVTVLEIMAPWLVWLAAGDDFAGAVVTLRILGLSIFISILNNFFGLQTMIPHGHKQAFSRIVLVSGLLSLSACLPLTWFFTSEGAAVAVVLAELLIFLALYRFHRNNAINVLVNAR